MSSRLLTRGPGAKGNLRECRNSPLPAAAPLAACHGAFFAFAGQCGTSLGTAIRRGPRAPHRARQGCVPDCSGPHGAHVPAERRQQRRWHCFLWEGRAVGGGQLRASPGGLRGVGGKATGLGLWPRPVLLCRWTSLTKRKREKKIPKNVKTVTKVIENPVQCLLLSTGRVPALVAPEAHQPLPGGRVTKSMRTVTVINAERSPAPAGHFVQRQAQGARPSSLRAGPCKEARCPCAASAASLKGGTGAGAHPAEDHPGEPVGRPVQPSRRCSCLCPGRLRGLLWRHTGTRSWTLSFHLCGPVCRAGVCLMCLDIP